MLEYQLNINKFYENIKIAKFNEVCLKRRLEIILLSKQLNKIYNNKRDNHKKANKYVKIMCKINGNKKLYYNTNEADKYFVFMFSVDPDFEAAKIYLEENNFKNIKTKMKNKFGFYDPYLIYIEKYYIKYYMGETKKEKFDEEVEKRIYK